MSKKKTYPNGTRTSPKQELLRDKKITKDMTFGNVMERDPEAAFKLMDMGMMCGGCPIAQFETVEEGCNAHGTDVKEILDKLNEGNK